MSAPAATTLTPLHLHLYHLRHHLQPHLLHLARPRYPDWSIIKDCCLKFNRTVGHGESAFFWTAYGDSPCRSSPLFLAEDDVDPPGCIKVNGMGLVVGRFGRILRTSDGGATWTNVPSPTRNHLHGLSFNEQNTKGFLGLIKQEDVGWAVGDAGTVLMTTDRGETWEEITNQVITDLGTSVLKNGRRLAEVSLRSVKHHLTGEEVLALGTSAQEYQLSARMLLIVGDASTILRYKRRPPAPRPRPTSPPLPPTFECHRLLPRCYYTAGTTPAR